MKLPVKGGLELCLDLVRGSASWRESRIHTFRHLEKLLGRKFERLPAVH